MIYEAECRNCKVVLDYERSIEFRFNTPQCPKCGSYMNKVIMTAPKGFVKGEIQSFKSTVDGTTISTQKDLQDHNKRNNVVSINDGYDDASIRSGKFAERKPENLTKEIKKDMTEAIQQLNDGYRPKLEVQENE